MTLRNEIINEIIEVEGGYGDDPSDSGGETNYGITKAVARKNGYKGKMIDLPRSVAFLIYQEKYWDAISGNALCILSDAVAREVADTAVNMGVSRASKILQRALNAFNMGQRLYPDLGIDGQIGENTVSSLRIYLLNRNEDALVKALNCLQGAFYIELSERREKDEKFIYGWFRNRIKI